MTGKARVVPTKGAVRLNKKRTKIIILFIHLNKNDYEKEFIFRSSRFSAHADSLLKRERRGTRYH